MSLNPETQTLFEQMAKWDLSPISELEPTQARKLNKRIARLDQQITRQRKQWHFQIAGELVDKAEVIFIAGFLNEILRYKAASALEQKYKN